MSLRGRLILTTVTVSFILSLSAIALFLFIAYLHINASATDIYKSVSRSYRSILKELSDRADDVVVKLDGCKQKNLKTYVLLKEEGLFIGRVKDCVFYGAPMKEAIDFTASVGDLRWLIAYDRYVIERVSEKKPEFMDRFIKDRVAIGDYILEGYTAPTILRELGNLTGYALVDRYRLLLIDFPIVVEDSVPAARVIFIKDFSKALMDAVLTPMLFLGYTLTLVGTLSTVLFFTFNPVVRDVSFLRKVAYRFKELDFSDIKNLSEMLRKEKRRDELYYLKRSILTMAQELEALIYQLKEDKSRFEELAYTDPLTGLRNRRFFLEELKEHLELAKRYGEPLSLIMLDVDNFKNINDEYGHDVGDLVLKKLAQVIEENVRSSDIAARFGGEEFVIALPKTSGEEALLVAERIRQGFKRARININGLEVSTTLSAGVSTFTGSEDIDTLIKEADKALYQAKRTGRDKVVAYGTSP